LAIAIVLIALRGAPADAARLGKNGMIVYANGWGGGYDAHLDLTTVNPDGSVNAKLLLPVDGGGRQADPEWSPDGNEIAYVHDRGLRIYDLRTSRSRTVSGAVNPRNPTWSPSGDQVAYVTMVSGNAADGEIWVINRDGSNPRRIRGNCGAIGSDLDWGPNGRLAFETVTNCPGDPQRGYSGWSLVTMDATGADVRKVRDTRSFRVGVDKEKTVSLHVPRSIDWSPDGTRLLVVGEWGSWAQQIRCGVGFKPVDVWTVNAASGLATNITNTWDGEGPQEQSAAWSPDGTMIVLAVDDYSCKGTRTQDWVSTRPRIYTMSAAGGTLRKVTDPPDGAGQGPAGSYTLPTSDFLPSWQPCVAGKTVRCASKAASGQPSAPLASARGADVAVTCGIARFTFHEVTLKATSVTKGDTACVWALSNRASKELLVLAAAAGTGAGTLFGSELATLAGKRVSSKDPKPVGWRNLKVLGKVMPKAARTITRLNGIVLGGKVVALAGVPIVAAKVLLQITDHDACLAFAVEFDTQGEVHVTPRVLFNIRAIKSAKDAILATARINQKVEKTLAFDTVTQHPLNLQCGEGGAIVVGPPRDTNKAFASAKSFSFAGPG
jgi:WD40 repeat protein